MTRLLGLAACGSILRAAAGCGGSSTHAHEAKNADLSAITAVATNGVRNGSSGAPVAGVIVSGTVTNTDTQPLRCSNTAFVLMSGSDAILPASAWCAAPSLEPGQSAMFTATFASPPTGQLALQLTHPDGSYERHDLDVPQ
ncbi:MAG: hypothetical protein ACXVAK_16725 [Vulcanimicrobiaceae bacterium]